jgi:Helix-turn-helix domain
MNDQITKPLLVDIATAKRLLGISHATVYRCFEDGKLEKRKIGAKTLITMASIERVASGL